MNKAFDRILIVMFENQYRSYVMQDPYMQKLAAAGAELTNSFGAFHPSQTNYIASLAGEVCAVTNDDAPQTPLPQQTLVDLLEAAGVSWKAYMEAYPNEAWNPAWQNPDYPGSAAPLAQYPANGPQLARYFRKHNAFASFHSIQADASRWARIVDEVQFWRDVEAKALPEYGWFTPDIWNDGHYLYNTHIDTDPRTELVPQISNWLQYVFFGSIAADDLQGASAPPAKLGFNLDLDALMQDPQKAWGASNVPAGTLIVVTFDEADFDARDYDTNYDGPNQIYTVLLGDMIEPGTVIDTPLNHYGLIKTVERNFATGDLGKNDREANWLRGLWGQSFAWSSPQATGLAAGDELALACHGGETHLVCVGYGGALQAARFDGSTWSPAVATGLEGRGPLALAACGGDLLLVFAQEGGQLYCATCADGAWQDAQPLGHATTGAVAMAKYVDYADGGEKIMLCWRADQGFIHYTHYADGAWQGAAQAVGQLSDGPLALAQLGPSLYLVYKERNTRKMRMTSFNLAPFNAFAAKAFNGQPAPANDTSLHAWAPADVHVGNFAEKMAALQNDYQTDGQHLAMAAIEGEMHLVHRAAYADQDSAYSEIFGLTGIFTASNPDTNGYGTIDQAGWTLEQSLPGIELDPPSGLAMAADGQSLVLVWRPKGGGPLQYCTGKYS